MTLLRYWVRFSEHSYEISPPEEGDDRWRHQGDYGLNVMLRSIHRSEVNGFDVQTFAADDYEDHYGYDEIEPGSPAFIVVVEYTTGGTFGSHGAWTIPAIKADPDAAKEAEKLCYGDRPNRYRPWDGYFEHLNSVTIETLLVSP